MPEPDLRKEEVQCIRAPGRRLASATDTCLAKAAVADKRASVTGDPESCGAITRLGHACVIAAGFTICPEPPSFALFHTDYLVQRTEILRQKKPPFYGWLLVFIVFLTIYGRSISRIGFL